LFKTETLILKSFLNLEIKKFYVKLAGNYTT